MRRASRSDIPPSLPLDTAIASVIAARMKRVEVMFFIVIVNE